MPTPEQIEKYNTAFDSAVRDIENLNFAELYTAETGYSFNRAKQGPCVLCKSGTSGKKGSDGAFTYYASSNKGKCHACGAAVGTIKLIKHVHGIDYKATVLYLAKQYLNRFIENPYEQEQIHQKLKPQQNITVGQRKQISEEEARAEEEQRKQKYLWVLNQVLKITDTSNAAKYLAGRGIDAAKLPEGAYHQAAAYKTDNKQMPEGVVFLDSTQTLLNKRYIGQVPEGIGKSFNFGSLVNAVYDHTFTEKQETVFVNEGVINALSFFMLGHSAIALFGTTNEINDTDKFFHYFNGRNVVLAYDTDKAGLQAAMRRAAWLFENYQCTSIQLMLFPERADGKADDANDLLQSNELASYIDTPYNFVHLTAALVKKELAAIKADREYIPNLKPQGYYSRPAASEEKDGTITVTPLEKEAIGEAYKAVSSNPDEMPIEKEKALGFVPIAQAVSITGTRAHVHLSTPDNPLFMRKWSVKSYQLWRPLAKKPFRELMFLGKKERVILGHSEIQKAADLTAAQEMHTEELDELDNKKPTKKVGQKAYAALFICFNLQDLLNLYACGYYGIMLESGYLDFATKKELKGHAEEVYILSNRNHTKMYARDLGLMYNDLRTFYIPRSHKPKTEAPLLVPHKTATDLLAAVSIGKFKRMLNTALPFQFWDFEKNDYTVNLIHLRHLLEAKGFYTMKAEQNKKGFMFIQIEGRVVNKFIPDKDEFSRHARNFTDDYLCDQGEDSKLRSKVAKSVEMTENNLGGLRQVALDFENSGKHFQNWFFDDGNMWTVTKSGIKVHPQKNLQKFIWKEELLNMPSMVQNVPFKIIQRPAYAEALQAFRKAERGTPEQHEAGEKLNAFLPIERYDIEILDPSNYFLQYLFLTGCAYWEKFEKDFAPIQKELFFSQFEGKLLKTEIDEMKLHLISRLTWLGYIMQDYRSMEHQQGVAIIDMLDFENRTKSAAGGGKSIITAAVSSVKYAMTKKADREDWCSYPHRYEDYMGEKVIIADDMHRLSKIGDMLTDFSLGIEVNPKHKGSVQLPLADSPKIIVTRNFIDDEGQRVDRRLGRIFVTDYFHGVTAGVHTTERNPKHVFGRALMVEDTAEQSASLVNLFAYMYVSYMNHGTINPPMGNIDNFRLAKDVGELLISFMDEYLDQPSAFGYLDKKQMYDAFKIENLGMSPANKARYNTAQKFKTVVAKYCQLRDYVFNPVEMLDKQKRIMRLSEIQTNNQGQKMKTEHFYIQTRDAYEKNKTSIAETNAEPGDLWDNMPTDESLGRDAK